MKITQLKVKIIPVLSCVIGVCGCAYSQGPSANDLDTKDAGKVIDGFQLTAHTEKSLVDSGDPIIVELYLKNMTATTLSVSQKFNLEHNFFVIVQDKQGHLIPFTKGAPALGSKDDVSAESDIGPYPLDGHGFFAYKIKINQIYDMSTPETYTITVKRILENSQNNNFYKYYVVSNKLEIQVRPSPAIFQWQPTPVATNSPTKKINASGKALKR